MLRYIFKKLTSIIFVLLLTAFTSTNYTQTKAKEEVLKNEKTVVIQNTIESIRKQSRIYDEPIVKKGSNYGTGEKTESTIITSPEQIASVTFNANATTNSNIALLYADGLSFATDVKNKLTGTGFFSSITLINVYASTPTLAQLQTYDAVLVWSNIPFNSASVLGNNLADYVDGGGGVVVGYFAYVSILKISGRFDSDNYWAISVLGGKSSHANLGTIFDSTSPLVAGVSTFDGGSASYRAVATISNGAIRIADWSDGNPLIATKVINGTKRVDLNFFPPSQDGYGLGWLPTTDGARIMANALLYVGRSVPTPPTLLSPTDGLTGQSRTPTLTWATGIVPTTSVQNRLEISTSSVLSGGAGSSFNTTEYGTLLPAGAQANVVSTVLDYGTTYYWHVKTIEATPPYNESLYADPFSFTTKLATPNQSSPADAATGVSLAPTLEWDAVTNADNYRLEVNTDAGFGGGTLIYDNAALTTNSKQIGGLSDNVTYYWRVTATNTGGNTSEVSGVFSFTTERTTLTSPADNAVFVSSPSTTLSWPATTGADKYHLEVNTASNFGGTVVFDDATLTSTSQLVSGLNNNAYYFWRVSAVSNALAKAATSTVYQFHTKLATPVLTSPTDGSTAHQLTLTLDWSAVDGATTYYVVVATDAGFTSKVFESYDVSPNQQVISGLSSLTTYYWKVRARSSASSDSSDISSTFNFKTTGFSVDQLPVPSWPIGGATVYTTTPTLNWYLGFAPYTTVKYSLQYSTDASYTDPAQVVRVSGITDLNYAITSALTAGATYHWRVKIHTTDDSDSTDYCNSVSFVVSPTASGTTVAPKPIASWPVGGATVYTADPTLNWYLSTTSAELTFSVFYTTDPAYGTFTRVNGITDLNYALSGLTPGATYHWRVKSFSATDSSDYSDNATFVVNSTAGGGGTAPKPIASWPVGGATVYSISPTLNWYLGSDATGLTYSLFYTTDPAYGTFTRVNGITELSYALSGLTPGATYHWRVKSFSGTDSSDYSDDVTFAVNSTASGATAPKPVASWPVGGATIYSTAPSLSWYLNTSSAGLTFSLFYTTDPAYGTFTRVNGITDLSYALSGLTPGATYHWRVKSFTGTDSSDYSDDVTFVVDNSSSSGTSPKPINSWPVGGATVYSFSPTFNWYLLTGTSGTITYELEVVPFPDAFSGSGTTGISSNTYVYPGTLTAGTAYQWRVRVISTVTGTSDWSNVSTFSIYTPYGAVAAPLVGDPVENVSIFSSTASLSWYLTTKPAGNQKYRVEVAKNKDMVNPIIQIDNIEGFTKAVNSLTSGTYFWRVMAKTDDGKYSNYSNIGSFQITGVTAVDNEKNVIPESFTVSQNYPNPFNPSTIIKFGLPEAAFVSLKIYNVLGQEVKNLLNDQKNAGTYSVQWNGDNNFGHKVSSGTYIYRVIAGNYVVTNKMVLLK